MGYIRHHAIAVTSTDEKLLRSLHEKAVILFGDTVTAIIPSPLNSYETFFIAPDGSKEGWTESNIGDQRRNSFVLEIESKQFSDKSNSVRYAHFYYGDDNGYSEILNHN